MADVDADEEGSEMVVACLDHMRWGPHCLSSSCDFVCPQAVVACQSHDCGRGRDRGGGDGGGGDDDRRASEVEDIGRRIVPPLHRHRSRHNRPRHSLAGPPRSLAQRAGQVHCPQAEE